VHIALPSFPPERPALSETIGTAHADVVHADARRPDHPDRGAEGPAVARARNSDGVTPVLSLKIRLNAAFERKPTSKPTAGGSGAQPT